MQALDFKEKRTSREIRRCGRDRAGQGCALGAARPLLNEVSGVRLPDLTVPLATYTGWNLRHPQMGAPDQLMSLMGSTIPFPATRRDREALGDPRPSISERYPSKTDYLAQVRRQAQRLVEDGHLLADDPAARALKPPQTVRYPTPKNPVGTYGRSRTSRARLTRANRSSIRRRDLNAVGGFTRHPSPGVAPAKNGTYAGLIEKIPYLQDLGISAVELLPVFAFDEQDGPPGLGNYWGYQPLSFFAPHAG
jgi:Alpha/beta hydrolase domain